jgi:hypothetical protein
MGPVEWAAPGSSFDQLQQQVEQASAKAGRRAILMSFSLGGPYAATFLQQHVDQAWQEQHVEALISLSGQCLAAGAALLQVPGCWCCPAARTGHMQMPRRYCVLLAGRWAHSSSQCLSWLV